MRNEDRRFIGALLVVCGLMTFFAGVIFGLIDSAPQCGYNYTTVVLFSDLYFMFFAPLVGFIVTIIGIIMIVKSVLSAEH